MIKIFKNFNKKDITLIITCILLIICLVWLELEMPDHMSAITRLVQTEGSTMNSI